MRVYCHSKAASEILSALGLTHLAAPDPAGATHHIRLEPITTLEGMLDAVLAVGQALAEPARAMDLLVRLRARLNSAQDHVNPYLDGPPVFILDALDPLRVPGLWVPQLIERAGGQCPWNPTTAVPEAGAAAGPQMAYRTAGQAVTITPEDLDRHPPEVVIFALVGMPMEEARVQVREFVQQDWFRELPAARSGRVVLVDGDALATPGPGLVGAFEFLVGFVNGREELIPESTRWERHL